MSSPPIRADLSVRPRALPTLDRAFDAVERVLDRLAVADPATLRSPRPVEDELSPTALPAGTLLVLDPEEFAQAEEDVISTVKDERTGGCVFVAMPDRLQLIDRRPVLREMGLVAPTFLFASDGPLPPGLTRLRRVALPDALRGYRFVVADTPGFRVALVGRQRRTATGQSGGFLGLWSGDREVVAEVTGALRASAAAAGQVVPPPSPAVPPLEGIDSEADVWRHAAELRAHRVVREAELREIARAAALKGVALRRERERAAS